MHPATGLERTEHPVYAGAAGKGVRASARRGVIVRAAIAKGSFSKPADEFEALAGHGVRPMLHGKDDHPRQSRASWTTRKIDFGAFRPTPKRLSPRGQDAHVSWPIGGQRGRHHRGGRHAEGALHGGGDGTEGTRARSGHAHRRQPPHGAGHGQGRLGIARVLSEVLPQDKTEDREELQAEGERSWPWSGTASTTPRRWPRPTWASPSAPAPMWPSRPRTSR